MDLIFHASTAEEMREEVLMYIENRYRRQHSTLPILRLKKHKDMALAVAAALRDVANDLRDAKIEQRQ